MIARTCLLVALAFVTGVAWAQIYRWTDEKGRVHITDTPPPPGAKSVQKSRAPAGASAEGNEPLALQAARKNAPITLYTAPSCEHCGAARQLLNARGVPFNEVSVLDDRQIEDLKNAVGGNTVPSIVVGRAVQQGFEESLYHSMLDAAGYPKTGVLPPRAQTEPKLPPGVQAKTEKPGAETPSAPSGPYAPGARPQRQKKQETK